MGLFGLGGSKSSSEFDQNVWGKQQPYLTQLYGNSADLYGNTLQGMNQQIPGATNWMNQVKMMSGPYWEQQMRGGVYGNMDLQNQYMDSMNRSMDSPSAMQEINNMIMGGSGNNYADAMKGQYVQDANVATENMLRNLDARASASGMSGGSRHGTATTGGLQDINRNLQRNLANTGYNTFDKDLQRKLDIAGQADANTLQRQQMLSNNIQQQQQTMNQGLNYGQQMQNLGLGGFSPYMMPWQPMTMYSNVVGAPTVLGSGSSSGSSFNASIGG